MSIIYLVRHGAYENPDDIQAGRLPLSLSPEGIRQAEKLHDYFKNKEVEMVYSSPVLRCKQTAESIAGKKIRVIFDLRLAETFSAYQGWKTHDPKLLFGHRKELGGESFEDLKSRMMSFFNEVTAKSIKNNIICSHGDPLWCLYLGLLGRPLTNEITEPGENGNPEYLKKGAIRPIEFKNGKYTALDMVLQEELS